MVTLYIPTFAITSNSNNCVVSNVTLTGTGGNQGSYTWNSESGPPQMNPFMAKVNGPTVYDQCFGNILTGNVFFRPD